jgi:hypothetical protein
MNDPHAHPLHSTTHAAVDGIDVRVVGLVRGRELDAGAKVSLHGNNVVLAWDNAAPWQLDLEGIDGVMPHGNQLTLRTFSSRLLDYACTVPELTRGLRSLGSLRGAPGPEHDRWFAPLLAARRTVAGISDAERQVALVDAAVIAQQLNRVIMQLSQEMAPSQPAMQRAIDAALQEESEPVFEALERLALAADVLRVSTLDTRLVDWRRWMNALREVFVAADSAWPRCAVVISQGV